MHGDWLEYTWLLFPVIFISFVIVCSEICLRPELAFQGIGKMVDSFRRYKWYCVWFADSSRQLYNDSGSVLMQGTHLCFKVVK